jgi:hypothetical protein
MEFEVAKGFFGIMVMLVQQGFPGLPCGVIIAETPR